MYAESEFRSFEFVICKFSEQIRSGSPALMAIQMKRALAQSITTRVL